MEVNMRPAHALSLVVALLSFACDSDKFTAPSALTTLPTPIVTATPAPVPTPAPIPFQPFQPVFTVSPDPADGTDPLQVTFDMCATTGIKLTYEIDTDVTRGLGPRGQVPCRVTFTFVAQSRIPVFTTAMPTMARPTATEMHYDYRITVTDTGRTPPVSAIKEGTIHVLPDMSKPRAGAR
jgi:hypothetical protein